MDSFDRQILQFVVLWAPFGGPPDEDVLPSFGLTAAQFRRRLNEIVSKMTSSAARLTDDDAELLAAIRRIRGAPRDEANKAAG